MKILAVAICTGVVLAGCSSTDATPTDTLTGTSACEVFDQVAVNIEAQGPAADVESALSQILALAEQKGEAAVASATQLLQNAKANNSPSQWYEGLGQLEAACATAGDQG